MRTIKNITIIPEKIKGNFKEDYENYQLFVFSAFCGYGKTTIVKELLKEKQTLYIDLQSSTQINLKKHKCECIVFDNIRSLESHQTKEIMKYVQSHPKIHYFFLTRGIVPGWLLPSMFRGQLKLYEEECFKFSTIDIMELAKAYDLELSTNVCLEILKTSIGNGLAIQNFLIHLESEHIVDPNVYLSIAQITYHYMDEMVLNPLSNEIQTVVLRLALFDTFTKELVAILNPNVSWQRILSYLTDAARFIQRIDGNTFQWRPHFQLFLIKKVQNTYTQEQQESLYKQAGSYYQSVGDIVTATKYYAKGKADQQVLEILVENSKLNPSRGYYQELSAYYLQLDESIINQSPYLLAGMSMLLSLQINYEKSEYYYQKLVELRNYLQPSDPLIEVIRIQIIYLDLALPQRKNDGIISIANKVATLIKNKKVELPKFSLTSLLPSIMNGGKDFSDLSPKDELLYKTMKTPLSMILGEDGIGFGECAICESKFEKGIQTDKEVVKMMSMLTQIQTYGTPDVEFAVVGLMARILTTESNIEKAKESILELKERFIAQENTRFLGNIDALLCKMALLQGDDYAITMWLQKQAPKNNYTIWVLHRYQYITKVECLIQQEQYLEAISILAQLKRYTKACNRVVDEIHVSILFAICYHRQNNKYWQEEIRNALTLAQSIGFIRPISYYGNAILPMLKDPFIQLDNPWYDKMLLATKKQASLYQSYLVNLLSDHVNLSKSETLVLHLLCQNKTNAQIGQTLGIKLTTVKTHVRSIFTKLGVSNRSQAVAEAKRLMLVK